MNRDEKLGFGVSFGIEIQPAKERPFAANFQVYLSVNAQEMETRGEVWRDSLGRVRLDTRVSLAAAVAGSLPILVTQIYDHVGGRLFCLNHSSKTFSQVGLTGTGDNGLGTIVGEESAEILETQELEGLRCTGLRRLNPDGSLAESWKSEELGIVVASRLETGSFKRRWQLSKIKREEPDPALFIIPDGYAQESGQRE